MKTPFCDHHLQAFFSSYQQQHMPLDILLNHYFKSHKSLGARDRRIIGDTVYGMVRWKSLLDYLCPSPLFTDRLSCFKTLNFEAIAQNEQIPKPARLGVPQELLHRLEASFGAEKAQELCRICNTQALPTVRANLLKTSREHLMTLWKPLYPLSACTHASAGIRFHQRLALFSFPEFKEGFFEMQDEGSQIISSQVQTKPGELVLDYCSGSGGKTLAFAPAMQGLGQIYLHDIRPSALMQAKKRLRRAGIQNAQCLCPNHPELLRIKGKCNWVLIDVPCSGTGTLRRNPDQKWLFNTTMLQRLIDLQRTIACEAIPYLHPKGKLVYATCSMLFEENQAQVNYLLKTFPLTLAQPPLSLLPEEGGMDGFFAAIFQLR